MGDIIKNLIVGLIGSKKFIVLVSGLIVTALAKYKLDLDPVMIQGMLGALIAWLIGQGIADNGKEAAKVKPAQVTPTELKPTT